jgi:hypothetical protein
VSKYLNNHPLSSVPNFCAFDLWVPVRTAYRSLAGYGPCLAATLALQKAKLLPEDTPAKVAGPPGEAFYFVYSSIASIVGRKVHNADPALAEWIRVHLYGDVYSSPGIDMRQKQLLMCARLAQADMGEQLFGHAIAGLRFGNSYEQLRQAIDIAFDAAQQYKDEVRLEALKIVDLATAKFEKDLQGGRNARDVLSKVEAAFMNCESVLIPELLLGNEKQEEDHAHNSFDTSDQLLVGNSVRQGSQDPDSCVLVKPRATSSDDDDDGIKFAWEELDLRPRSQRMDGEQH